MATKRRILAITAGVAGGVLGLSLLGLIGGAIWLRSASGSEWLRRSVVSALATGDTEASIGAIHTDLWTGARIEDFHLAMPGMIIDVGQLDADIDRNALMSGELRFKRAVAEGVLVDLSASPVVEGPVEPSEPFAGIGIDLAIDAIDLRGAQVIYRNADGEEIVRVVGGSGTARFVAQGPEIRVEELDITALVGLMGAVAAHVKGEVVVDAKGTHLNDLDVRLPNSELAVDGSIEEELGLKIAAKHLTATDLDALIGRPGLAGTLSGGVDVTGPTDQIRWAADLAGIEGTQGSVKGSGTVDLRTDTLGWTVDADLENIDASQLYPGVGESLVLSGRAVVDGKGTAWPDDLVIDVNWDGRSHDGFGQHIDAAKAVVHIEDGAVELRETTLDGIIGELSLTGRIELVDGPMDVRATGWIRPHRLRELGISGVDSSGWLDARIQGELSNPDAPIHITGTVRFTPFRSGDSIRFDSALARFDVDVLGEVVEGTASVDATAGDVAGIGVATAKVESLRFSTGPKGLSVAGDVQALSVGMPDVFSTAGITGVWGLTDAGATARLDVGPYELFGIHGTRGHVVVDQSGDVVKLGVGLDDDARALLETNGQFDLALSALRLDFLRFSPTPRAEWSSTRPVAFTLTDGGLKDADIAMGSAVGSIELTGTVGTKGPLDGHLSVKDLALDAIAEVDPEALPGLLGTVDLDVTLTGQADDPVIDGTVDAKRISYADSVNVLDAVGTVHATATRLSTVMDIGVAGAPVAHLTGGIPLHLNLAAPALDPAGPTDLALALLPGSLDRLRTLAPAAESLPTGRVGGIFRLSGPLRDPDMHLAGVLEMAVPGWLDAQRTEFEITRTDGALSGWADARNGQRLLSQLFLMAQTDLRSTLEPALETGALADDFDWTTLASDLYLTGVILEVPVDMLTAIGGYTDLPLAGQLTGGFQVTGSPSKPALDGSLNWVDGRIGRQPLDGMDLILSQGEHGYDIDLRADFTNEVLFSAVGTLPIVVDLTTDYATWERGPMDIRLEGALPLRALAALTKAVGKPSGNLALNGVVRGTLGAPEPAVKVALKDASINVNSLGIRVEDLTLDADATRDSITLNDLSGTTRPIKDRIDLADALAGNEKGADDGDSEGRAPARPSSFKVVGDVALANGTLGDVNLRARLDNSTWVMATGDTALRVDGKIRVGGTYPALVAGGDLTLKQGLVKLNAAAFVDRAPLELDPRIHFTLRGVGKVEEIEEPPWYNAVTAAVEFDLRRALELEVAMPFVDDLGSVGAFVSRADLNARLGGQSQLTMANGELSMVGELELVDGRLKMLGRRFDVESGRITFTGGPIAEPRLDIVAGTTVSNIPVTATVSGTPTSPEITPECDGYPSESDCLTILITGRAPDAEGGGNNTTAALAGMVLGGLLGEQNFADISFEPDGSVQAGAAISNSIYLTYTLASRAEIGENLNTIEVDLGLGRRVVLNVAGGDEESWMDLFWEIRF